MMYEGIKSMLRYTALEIMLAKELRTIDGDYDAAF